MNKNNWILFFLLIPLFSYNQIVVLDAGHGYYSDCTNGDGRTLTEINTAHEVSIRLKNMIENYCSWTVHLTRPNNGCGSWVSVTQRGIMANSWDADVFLSIHCNAGGGTGTETFWCDLAAPINTQDQAYATEIQTKMAQRGNWNWRRVVEDYSYLPFHLGVLKNLNMHGCLSEIGFVDSPDSTKLLNTAWRDSFTLAYFDALRNFLGDPCSLPPSPLMCDSAAQVMCGQTFLGTASSDPSYVTTYGCNNWTETGPERVHKITISDTAQLGVTIRNFTGDLDVYILGNCDPQSCLGTVYSSSALYKNAPPGEYYIVVDADDGSGSAYHLLVNCENKPDLISERFIPSVSFFYPGQTLSVDHRISNMAGVTAQQVYSGYYIGTDSLLTGLKYKIHTEFTDSVRAVLFNNLSVNLTIPSFVPAGNYYLGVMVDDSLQIPEISENNNVYSIPIYVSAITSQNDIQIIKQQVKIFPNPTNALLNIEMPINSNILNIQVYDVQGRILNTVYTHEENKFVLNVHNYAKGIYYLQFNAPNGTFSQKFIKTD